MDPLGVVMLSLLTAIGAPAVIAARIAATVHSTDGLYLALIVLGVCAVAGYRIFDKGTEHDRNRCHQTRPIRRPTPTGWAAA